MGRYSARRRIVRRYDDKSIGVQDAQGVTLAAIKGLREELNARDAKIAALERTVDELRRAVESIFSAR